MSSKQLGEMARRFGELDRAEEAQNVLDVLAGRDDDDGRRVDDLRAELVRKLLAPGKHQSVAAHLEKVASKDDPLLRAAAVASLAQGGEPGAIAKLDELLRVELDHGVCMLEIADMLHASNTPPHRPRTRLTSIR